LLTIKNKDAQLKQKLKNQNNKTEALVVTSDPEEIDIITQALSPSSYKIQWIKDGHDLDADTADSFFDIILLSPILHNSTKESSLSKALRSNPSCPILIISDPEDLELAKWAFRNGAYNILEKPLTPAGVLDKTQQSLDLKRTLKHTSLQDQDLGHLYNELKIHYYNIDHIVRHIKLHNLDHHRIGEELNKKKRLGCCLFDFIDDQKTGS